MKNVNTKDILEKSDFLFELIYNDSPIRTAQEGADYFNVDIAQIAPTLILYTGIGFHVLVISGERGHVNFKEIKHLLHCKNVRLATKEEVKSVTGFSVGNVPMFGIPLPYIVDKRLLQFSFIYGGLGEENTTLKVDPRALFNLNKVVGSLE
ncbi:YbaK/EbsC family protein [Sporomusa sp. KB1]|jgi:prolyl-tRNA editing enzyme YbaK/EbsC (Cys-tRNA(Pro) deacylase)|uniref:YbaK/EbsC family protein n=1 Tax=Sporomusa sp. KB1 TaxID=943346 RepID=UPI00119F3FC7|nr:YbaK/EbsC family protein [Sporomusa sp. KB1]TWH49447.1 prolyl-tRNA editing enzyme YbaK/EbsC (Cys-tRNA(Pro) deacylase) [Sporomusa sp. KB1]